MSVMQKLIDKKRFEAKCEYCAFARVPDDRSMVLCTKKGLVDFSDSCRRFKYDPLKRIPVKISLNTDFTEDDFKL